MQEAFWIESQGQKMLSIMEYDPKFSKGENMVVLIHGFAGTKVEPHRMYRKLSQHLSNLGFTVLRFDFVGSGDSDGDFKDMTISREIEDGINVIRYCKNNFPINKLYILGYSMGGCVAASVGNYTNCDALVLWSPVSNPFWNFHHLLGKEKFKEGLDGNDVDYLGDTIGHEFFEELLDINPLEKAQNYKNPVCIIHGTEDEDVLPFNAYAYGKRYPNNTTYFVDGADHCYSSKDWEEELLLITIKFLKNLI